MVVSNTKPQIDRETLRIFWRMSLSHRRELVTSILFPVNTILLSVIAPLFIGKALGALIQPYGHPETYLVLFILTAGAGLIANRLGHPAMVRHQALTMRDVQELSLTVLMRRSVGFHNNNVGGKLVSDAIDYPAAFSQLHSTVIGTLLPFSLTLVFGSIIILLTSWPLGLFIIAMTGVVIGLGIYDSRRMHTRRQHRLKATKDVTAHLADAITNVQTVKMFGREDEELQTHRQLAQVLTNARLDDWHLMSTRGNKRLALVATFQALFVLITIALVRVNPSLLGVGIFAFTFTIMLSNRLFEVNLMIRNIEDALVQATPMTTIILETPEIRDAPNARRLHVSGGDISFNHVAFRYQDAGNDERVFNALDLAIAPGEKVGLVGPSGGGKSTFTRLLLRFEDVSAGTITIDGQNIAEVTQHSLRRAIAYVPQEPLLFHRSIGENISYGNPSASRAAIQQAARLAHAADFIDKLPQGYDTIVGERGVKLSGGQRQRVAIARAILKNAPILILDEATSALDSESEAHIQNALWELMDGRTAIVVAHRLSTIQKMDRIIVLDNGQIIEQGAHEALLAADGVYTRLWKRQSGGFIQE